MTTASKTSAGEPAGGLCVLQSGLADDGWFTGPISSHDPFDTHRL